MSDFTGALRCLVDPLVTDLSEQLAGVGGLGGAERAVILAAADRTLADTAHRRLCRVLVLELNAARPSGRLDAADSEARWAQFLDLAGRRPYWDELTEHYPTMLTRLQTALANSTFQGWTALSDMAHDQGVLHTVPIPAAMAYLLLRPLLSDVPDDEMCGVTVNQVFPAGPRWHAPLLQALSGIPDVRAGDSVWWHCDMVHSVAPVENQQGWGNVMYIPAAPWCARNERYAARVREALRTGSSPSDFPAEHYERTWADRFQAEDLNDTGRRGLGL